MTSAPSSAPIAHNSIFPVCCSSSSTAKGLDLTLAKPKLTIFPCANNSVPTGISDDANQGDTVGAPIADRISAKIVGRYFKVVTFNMAGGLYVCGSNGVGDVPVVRDWGRCWFIVRLVREDSNQYHEYHYYQANN